MSLTSNITDLEFNDSICECGQSHIHLKIECNIHDFAFGFLKVSVKN